ncbi:uncharacterized protein [Triticum aestivum]|uniref:uncharacterized protein isoform X2 n=1 Tax=Triticum aestivum TaxID=4565 RepID=UPI000842592D|nr:uncharacterized protein LOC123107984 isoform X2 [Triticum aestivum]
MAARARAVAAMSSSSSVLLAAAVALTLLVSSASAQSGCTTALVGLYPCMNYISGNDTAPTNWRRQCSGRWLGIEDDTDGVLAGEWRVVVTWHGGSGARALGCCDLRRVHRVRSRALGLV